MKAKKVQPIKKTIPKHKELEKTLEQIEQENIQQAHEVMQKHRQKREDEAVQRFEVFKKSIYEELGVNIDIKYQQPVIIFKAN